MNRHPEWYSRASFRSAFCFLSTGALLAACVQNPGVLPGSDASAIDGGLGAADGGGMDSGGVEPGGDGGGGGGAEDASMDEGGAGGAGGEEAEAGEGCVPNPDDDGTCPLICPEVCDGADNDCDGEVDEAEASLSCDLPNATAQCVKGDCVIADCTGAYGDCNGESGDGCEAPLDTLQNCGACGSECDKLSCAGGVCSELECAEGYADCDGDPDTGCEASLSSLLNCAMCGRVCSHDNARSSCESGQCEFVECAPGYGDCDGEPANGCEVQLDTLEHCGECGNECDEKSCAGGECTDLECGDGYADCDGDADNGCETELLSSQSDCGMCGRSCDLDHTVTECDDGQCEIIQCRIGFDDCDGDALNGCESALDSLDNCGRCGVRCEIPDGEASCAGGICTAARCNEGYADCDGKTSNGCETSLTSLTDCGMCGQVCDLDHASESCDNRSCEIDTCESGWGDCNGESVDGCETQLGTLANCSGCGDACGSLPNVNAATCQSNSCQITACNDGFADCNSGDGCETQLGTTENCGDCGDACTEELPQATTACTGTPGSYQCGVGQCDPDWGDCDASPGCETDITTDTDCGGCGNLDSQYDCTALPGVDSVSCVSGECVYSGCAEGFLDCDLDPANGCEVESTVCWTVFAYAPSNFNPDNAGIDVDASGDVTLDCGVSTFDSENLTFGNWCSGQPQSTPAVLTQTSGPEVVVLPFRGLTIAAGSTLDLTGNRPVILAVYGDANIAGQVNASAGGTTAGPGADFTGCSVPNGNEDTESNHGGSGGGGGGFGLAGGGSGSGDAGGSSVSGGAANGNAELVPLRGGCSGGTGGRGNGSSGGREGGGGGGAVQISAAGTLTVSGTVSAAGGGGRNGTQAEDGGGGGGSGGAVLLEGKTVTIDAAALTANGGGGASGNDTDAADGNDGTNGSQTGTSRANGGTGDHGGDGGRGGASSGGATDGGNGQSYSSGWTTYNGAGGGGGGGGVGRIRINSPNACTPSGTFSPAPSVTCP